MRAWKHGLARLQMQGANALLPLKCMLPFSLSAPNLAHRVRAWSQLSFHDMIELIQFPWSPFCIVQRRILEFSGARFKITNIPNGDRTLVWKLSKERYYGVPIIRDGKSVIFEVSEDSQVIAKYIDSQFGLGLFPRELEGEQSILWRYIENEVEGL